MAVLPVINDLTVFSRDEFRKERFDYRAGEHVLFAGPTQKSGKTTLAFQLLQYIASPDFPAYVAVSKPKDPVTSKWGRTLGFRMVREWPPAPSFKEAILREKPPGYLIWPKFGDIHEDVERCRRVTSALLKDRYAAGVKNKKGILVCDDTVVKSKIYHLDDEMTTIITMAGAMDIGGWFFVQKPTDSGRSAIWSYGNSEHVFLFYDADRRNRQRYDEIGGVESKFVGQVVQDLKRHQALYIKREGYMCIVDKN